MRLLPTMARFRTNSSLEQVVQAFEERCASGLVDLGSFWREWNPSRPASNSTLAALVKLDLQRRFDAGERPRIAEYLEQFPELSDDDEKVVSLIYEEFCLLGESGEEPDSQKFCEDYAPWRDSLLSQLEYHRGLARSIGAESPSPKFPEVGERFDKYTLDQVLGIGAAAKVYLATDDELGGRKLVIKVSDCFGQEPKIMGRLNHPNIVPILTYAKSDSGVRGICMPYRPGVTLEELIRRIGRGSPPRRARDLRDALESVESKARSSEEKARSGWSHFPVDGTYSEGVAWVGLILADALAYLHDQGVLHRDIKPANILLAHGAGPQLLDFNLAHDPHSLENVSSSMKGGTLPYMAPEHLQAFLVVAGWNDVGASADIYSLGLVLRELLTGTPPILPDKGQPLQRAIQGLILKRSRPDIPSREINPLIPPSLDSILEKCLAFETSDRYESVRELSEDLRRFLDRRPLKHAENPSRAERGANWLFRNRFLIALGLVSSLIFLGFLMARPPASVGDRSDFRKAESQLDSKQSTDWEKARRAFIQLKEELPGSAWPRLYLGLTLDKIDKKANAQETSRLIDQASQLDDAEEAIRARIRKDPKSGMLWSNLSRLLLRLHRNEEAREAAIKALELNQYPLMALSVLITLERSAGHLEAAVEYSRKIIALSSNANMSPEQIYAFRNVLIAILAKLADQAVDFGRNKPERALASRYLDEIESNLRAMTAERRSTPPEKGTDLHFYLEKLYQGEIASGRAVLDADAGDGLRAKLSFDEAERFYESARLEIDQKKEAYEKFRPTLLNLQQSLILRRLQYLDSDPVVAATIR